MINSYTTGDEREERQIYLSFRPHCKKPKRGVEFFMKKELSLFGHNLGHGLGIVQYSCSCLWSGHGHGLEVSGIVQNGPLYSNYKVALTSDHHSS